MLWGPPGTGQDHDRRHRLGPDQPSLRRAVGCLGRRQGGPRGHRRAPAGSSAAAAAETVLFVDEVHRFSKAQQDALLPGVENRWVTLIAATTENPFFSVISPLLSRSLLLTLEPLTDDAVREVVERALADERGLGGAVTLDDDALDQLVRLAGGDARRALTYLEAAAGSAQSHGDSTITMKILEPAVDRAAVRYDRQGDQHYDVITAFIKSIRGSDVDAALHYLARMIAAGEDPRFIARRLVILASEDIGLADPTALPTAVAAAQAVQLIGMPEARHQPRAGGDRAGPGPEVQRGHRRGRRGHRRRQRRQDRLGAGAPARRPLRRREEDQPRRRLPLRARRPARGRTAAARAGRGQRTPPTTDRAVAAPRPSTPSGSNGSRRSWRAGRARIRRAERDKVAA